MQPAQRKAQFFFKRKGKETAWSDIKEDAKKSVTVHRQSVTDTGGGAGNTGRMAHKKSDFVSRLYMVTLCNDYYY